jgi:hypothetical protein
VNDHGRKTNERSADVAEARAGCNFGAFPADELLLAR